MPHYCFVLGCARSGTTALVRLLSAHENVVIGMERYKNRLGGRLLPEFGPPLFEPERFLDFRDEDTNITPENERFRKHYEIAEERLKSGAAEYVGDKVTAREPVAAAIRDQFPEPVVFFIYRDPLRVASSYCVRARNPDDTNWPETRTHQIAVERWTEAFAAADLVRGERTRLFPVRYERLFNGDERTCTAMFHFLGLEVTADVRKHFVAATAHWDEHEAKRLELTEEQQRYVLDHADRAVLQRFDDEFERCVAEHATA